ncbi:MAG TPA: BatD family protein, partial [Chitinophagaceae bacterium]
MHCRSRDIIIPLTLLLFTNASLLAQVSVKATVDRTTILIGEPIKLNLEASVPVGTSFQWFKTDTIPHFEIVDPGKQDSGRESNTTIYRQQLIITSFDSGSWPIPAFVLQAGKKRYRTDTLGINVTYTPYDTAKDYNDIKDIVTVKNPGNPYIPWIIAAVTLLAAACLYYFLRKKKVVPKAPE